MFGVCSNSTSVSTCLVFAATVHLYPQLPTVCAGGEGGRTRLQQRRTLKHRLRGYVSHANTHAHTHVTQALNVHAMKI